jgi:hypothetical protein
MASARDRALFDCTVRSVYTQLDERWGEPLSGLSEGWNSSVQAWDADSECGSTRSYVRLLVSG